VLNCSAWSGFVNETVIKMTTQMNTPLNIIAQDLACVNRPLALFHISRWSKSKRVLCKKVSLGYLIRWAKAWLYCLRSVLQPDLSAEFLNSIKGMNHAKRRRNKGKFSLFARCATYTTNALGRLIKEIKKRTRVIRGIFRCPGCKQDPLSGKPGNERKISTEGSKRLCHS